MKIIGLTGGIGSGKSTVSRFLAELGAVIIDVDKVGHEALQTDKAREQLLKEFGKGILNASGEVDRARLGKLVFNDADTLGRLNRIMHPIIFKMVDARLEEYRRQGVDEVVLEAPLMLELGRSAQANEVWVTTAPEATVVRRIRERTSLSEEEARARIHAQLSNEEKIKHADVVIDTDCSLEELKSRVLALWMRNKTRFASFDVP